jgi:hypothetical protein
VRRSYDELMSEFEDRLRQIAQEISRTVERNIDDIAESFGVDPSRAREFAESAGQWLNDQVEGHGDELFGRGRPEDYEPAPESPIAPEVSAAPAADRPGPHPLDLPTGAQGAALAALDSGRWTVRPGTNVLSGTGAGPDPGVSAGLVGELRARDWISATGELTLVGRRALGRWYDAAEQPAHADRPASGEGDGPT